MFFDVLTQRANRPFLLSDGQFEFPVEIVDPIQVLGAKQFQEEGSRLRKVAEDVLKV